MKEHHVFCLWRKHDGLKKSIYDNFNVVEHKSFNLIGEERANKVRSIYEIYIVGEDERIWSKEPIDIIVVSVNSNYGIRTTAGTKNTRYVNTDIFDFKTNIRKNLNINFKYLHASDHITEANMVFKAFNMEKYITNFTMIDLKKCKSIRWNVNPFTSGKSVYNNTDNYSYINIIDSPHYKFLVGDKKPYIDYVSKIDTHHSDISKFKNLIQNFDYKNYGSCDRLINISYINNEPVIIDGLHRASIILKNNSMLESVVVKVVIIKNEVYK